MDNFIELLKVKSELENDLQHWTKQLQSTSLSAFGYNDVLSKIRKTANKLNQVHKKLMEEGLI